MSAKLSVKNLKLRRSGRDILDIEQFILNRGDVLAVVGPNGAGKSSLLQILAFLIEPDTGIIMLDGETVGNGNRLAVRRKLAMVFQESLLLDTTVQKNIEIPLRIRGVSRQEAVCPIPGMDEPSWHYPPVRAAGQKPVGRRIPTNQYRQSPGHEAGNFVDGRAVFCS